MDIEQTWLSNENFNFRMIDAEIAVKVFGWSWENWYGKKTLSPPIGSPESNYAGVWDENGLPQYLPYYTSNNADSLRALELYCETYIIEKLSNGGYSVTIGKYTSYGPSLPIAICFSIIERYGIKKGWDEKDD